MTRNDAAVRWGYAINQWDTNIDEFVRDRDHERALKTISISGFTGIELTALNFGPWEPWGNPGAIQLRYGSIAAMKAMLANCAIDAVSSWVLDPAQGFAPEPGLPGEDPLDASKKGKIIEVSRWFSAALAELGGAVLAVRPVGSAWRSGPLADDAIAVLADTWNAVGGAVQEDGIRLAMHFDFLSALRLDSGLERLIEATDPSLVGLALDTAEYAIAGVDPVSFYREHAGRIWHIQLKGAREQVSDQEAMTPHADQNVRTAGGERQIARWFFEPSDEQDLIDFEALAYEVAKHGYEGWIVAETDQSPTPAKSAMLTGWYAQKVLTPILAGQAVGDHR